MPFLFLKCPRFRGAQLHANSRPKRHPTCRHTSGVWLGSHPGARDHRRGTAPRGKNLPRTPTPRKRCSRCVFGRESRPRATHREFKIWTRSHNGCRQDEVLTPPRPSPLFYSLDSCASCTYLCLEDLERPPQSNLLLFTPVQAQYQARTRQYHPPTGLTRLRGSYSHRTVAGTRPKRSMPEASAAGVPTLATPRGLSPSGVPV